MPLKCCVPYCRGNYDSSERVSVFKFPSDSDRRNTWLSKIQRKGFQPSNSSVVCARHFIEEFLIRQDSVTRPDGSILTVARERPKLSFDAYPSIFPKEEPSSKWRKNRGPSGKCTGLVFRSMPSRWMPEKSVITPKATRPKPVSNIKRKTVKGKGKNAKLKRLKRLSSPEKAKRSSKAMKEIRFSFMDRDGVGSEEDPLALETLQMEDPDVDVKASLPSEQCLASTQQYMAAALDKSHQPDTAEPSTHRPRTQHLQQTGNCSNARGQHQTSTSMDDSGSAEFPHNIVVKQEVGSEQGKVPEVKQEHCDEDAVWLNICEIKKEAVTEYIPSQQWTAKREVMPCLNGFLQPACNPQNPRKQTGGKSEHSQMSEGRNQQQHYVSMLDPNFIKKEPEDLCAAWSIVGEMHKNDDGSEGDTETEIYPTGFYRNMHCAETGFGTSFISDPARNFHCR